MKIFRQDEQVFTDIFGIKMASLEAFPDVDRHGFAFGIIAAGEATDFHRHDECEAFTILQGSGILEADDGATAPVNQGDFIAAPPFEKHVLRNTGDTPLLFATVYWRDGATTAEATKATAPQADTHPPCFVFSTPPTPNGDLHLGHLSGPYFGADVFTRFQKLLGRQAFHITGSDDFQSYVIARGKQMNKTPQEVADFYASEIQDTLALLDVHLDQFTISSHAPGYQEGLKRFFNRLIASGQIKKTLQPAAFDPETNQYLYECDISGRCPTCGSGTGGNICEECGQPNLAYDLIAPVSNVSGGHPITAQCERYAIDLSAFSPAILEPLKEFKAAPRILSLATKVLDRDETTIPITHPQPWGVTTDDPEIPEQVIWAWPEMSYGFLYGIEAVGKKVGQNWDALSPDDNWRFVHFFGYDNSFYHAILYPALYKAAFPDWAPKIDYQVNEFYCLGGEKFSTSRRRAVWGKEVLSEETVDCVRFHLALTRGEVERTNFSIEALRSTNTHLIETWQAWLNQLGQTVSRKYAGVTPDAGDWSLDHKAFLRTLEACRTEVSALYTSEGFSLNQVGRAINQLVEDTARFVAAQSHLMEDEAFADRGRTTVALQLAAALLLADLTAPLMPRFSAALRAGLGCDPLENWPQVVELLPVGNRIDLADRRFFSPEIGNREFDMDRTDAA